LEAYQADYDYAKDTFEAVNEDLRRQEEAARQKQLLQQRNQVFNGAKSDVQLFAGVRENLADRIQKLEGRIAELEGANAETEEEQIHISDELEWRRDQLESQRAAMQATEDMQVRSTANLEKIRAAE
jgi:chromosome segregation ATPase